MNHSLTRSRFGKSLLILLLSGTIQVVSAATPNGWWLSLSGAAFSAGTPQDLDSTWTGQQGTPLHYSPQGASSTFTGFLGAGYQYGILSELVSALRLGAQYQYVAPITVKGNVNDSPVGAYTYQNKVSSNIVWLDAQADILPFGRFTPYLEAGIGAALNTFSNYSEAYGSGVTPFPLDETIYGNKSTWQEAYKAGLGLNYQLKVKKGNLAIGVFYNYITLGKASSAVASFDGSPRLTENITGNQYGLALRYNI